ncbi:RNB domain-containing ribonuclease [Glycomyces buryatensis]|uniref:RNB domain-containing ribonuclease n=1 Tax=Glycomyces buryatensis TaxID=2570927 RepID=UPI0014562B66|nr:RNB domain-containing ribonuclease [Glycomyces buryatensis]
MADYNPAETGIMIDADTTVDRDDAIWIESRGDGYDVWVHIARVADHVQNGGRADREAAERIHTQYRTDHTKHMLPKPIVEAASLDPDRDNDTFVVHLALDAGGQVLETELGHGRLTKSWVMSHGQAATGAADPAHELHDTLALGLRFAQTMLAARRATGALAFYDLLSGFATNEEGQLVRLATAERNSGYIIVQEFMIAANSQIASWAVGRDLPILFRNHRMAAVAGDPAELRQELDDVAASGDSAAFEMLRGRVKMVARPATYGPTVHGHHGLQLPVYTHATSPIRRYPDLITQRILLAATMGKDSPYPLDELTAIADDVNEKITAERQAKSEYFRAKAEEATVQRLEANDFSPLNDRDFARVVQFAIERGEIPGGLIAEIERRLDTEVLQLREFASVYFYGIEPAFDDLRRRLNRHLAAEPQLAHSLLNTYLQDRLAGPVTVDVDVVWDVESEPDYAEPVFGATVEIRYEGQRLRSAKRLQRSKKDARNQAALALVSHLAHLPDLSRDVEVSHRSPEVRKSPLVDPEVNPVEAVQIYAARGAVKGLKWTFESEGPSHERVFTCHALGILAESGDEVVADGTGPTKQASKTEAALALRVHIEVALQLGEATAPAEGLEMS